MAFNFITFIKKQKMIDLKITNCVKRVLKTQYFKVLLDGLVTNFDNCHDFKINTNMFFHLFHQSIRQPPNPNLTFPFTNNPPLTPACSSCRPFHFRASCRSPASFHHSSP
uniref:(northern house mosquito) hypothetical protein n=1 Tax=Culex pipiens TaxID=7175 RepID=A0A8D8A2L1_CULPI